MFMHDVMSIRVERRPFHSSGDVCDQVKITIRSTAAGGDTSEMDMFLLAVDQQHVAMTFEGFDDEESSSQGESTD
jgi:hypothetical protein